jgi:hypothetical protein
METLFTADHKKYIFYKQSRQMKLKMNCELMLTYDTPALWQTGSRNLMDQKTLPTIYGTFLFADLVGFYTH